MLIDCESYEFGTLFIWKKHANVQNFMNFIDGEAAM
jgi:hypothetical protein